ncbi:MAG: helix-turn-helix domain-containing protein [Lachnospiraceae bacterium]|nr:helix-turn-helix domain-containing protein [Lachnospiraceae bacterium]
MGERESFMDNIKFGKFIREARQDRGMTQKQLAEQIHVSDKAVSKWENGAGFPDIKILEPLAECLSVSLLELMQSERMAEPKIDRQEAEQAVAQTISQSRHEGEWRRRMWKVKVLLGACACGILYLAGVGIRYLAGQKPGAALERVLESRSSVWYENPVFFYVWAGVLVILCGAGAVYLLWKSESIREVKIGRHKGKSLFTILLDMLVVLLLHTYLSNIANNQQQLAILPEAIPVNAYITTADGSRQSGIFIKDNLVQGLLDSAYVEELKMDVRLKAGIDGVIPGKWHTLNLYLEGVNGIEALGGMKESDVVWNTGEDASILQGTVKKCIVSRKLFEKRGWKLGDRVALCQWYYYREDERSSELFMNPLQTVEYEIAGYVDMMGAWNDQFVAPPDVIVPFHAIRASYKQEGIPFFASSASFQVTDALSLNAFKQEMKDLGFRSVTPTVPDTSISGVALNVNDAVFISTAEHLRQVIDTVRAFFPFLLILIVGVGYLITLLLLQSRKNEMALLRSIGLNRHKCFRIFFLDQLTMVAAGVAAGSVLSVLIQGNYGGSSALAGGLVGICYMAGNSLALWRLLDVSVMEALFVAE